MVIASGGPECFHACWSLWPPVGPDEAEKANRRLVEALGADARAVDAARILRPPDTFSFKRGKPVTLEQLNVRTYTVEQVVGQLADPEPRRLPRRSPPVALHASADDPLLAIPPLAYVEALTRQDIGRDHKVACPFHDDKTPSLHVYERPKTPGSVPGWKCYGCGKAGDIIAFGAYLYGIEPRGAGYFAIRERLEADLLGAVAA